MTLAAYTVEHWRTDNCWNCGRFVSVTRYAFDSWETQYYTCKSCDVGFRWSSRPFMNLAPYDPVISKLGSPG